MRSLILAACLALVTAEASAISRYNSKGMSCDNVQSVVRNEGAVILRYPSSRSGMTLYDRYVAHRGFCAHGEVTRVAGVPASDTRQCAVLKCEPISDDDLPW
ncbi:MAG: hypothetical protein AB7I79_00280 [Rhizobiaceae bacterium]